jgi:hypothetical protein
MNQRIRELWDKAAASSAAYPSGRNNSWQTQVNFMNTFAELIAEDCANICDNFQARNVGMQPSECAGAIRHRFGVKG